MAENYYAVSIVGFAGRDAIENTLYYKEQGVDADDAASALLSAAALADRVVTTIVGQIAGELSAAYQASSVVVRAFKATGQPYAFTPVEVAAESIGVVAGALDGYAHTAVLAFQLLADLTLVGTIKAPKRGNLAIGPLVNSQVADNGDLIKSGQVASFADTITVLTQPVELTGAPQWYPIRTSMVRSGVDAGWIGAYSNVIGALWRTKTSFRRSRMNDR